MQVEGKKIMVAVRVEPALHALLKTAAHRQEKTLAEYVRSTLKEAAEFHARQA